MQVVLTQDIIPVTEFKKHIKDTFDQAHKTGRPVVLTVNGRADMVLIDAKAYEKQVYEAELRESIARGQADLKAGRSRPLKVLAKEIKREKIRRRDI